MKDKNNRGFTLIEVIAALVIICIIITGFSRVICSSMQAKKLSSNKNKITNWAQAVMEYMKTEDLSELQGTFEPSDFTDLGNIKEDYSGIEKLTKKVKIKVNNYNDNNINNNLYEINVIIKWKKVDQIKIYKLSTLVYQGED